MKLETMRQEPGWAVRVSWYTIASSLDTLVMEKDAPGRRDSWTRRPKPGRETEQPRSPLKAWIDVSLLVLEARNQESGRVYHSVKCFFLELALGLQMHPANASGD